MCSYFKILIFLNTIFRKVKKSERFLCDKFTAKYGCGLYIQLRQNIFWFVKNRICINLIIIVLLFLAKLWKNNDGYF